MNTKLRKSLMGGAIAALLTASPAWAAEESPGTYGEPIPRSGTVPPGQPVESVPAETLPQESAPARDMPGTASPGSAASSNPLYARTPEDLRGLEVVDVAGKKVGKLKTLVLGPDGQSAHAVISSGGFLGLGAHESIVSLDQLQLLEGGRLQASASAEDLAASGDYAPERYVELRPDRPISEFSAFEPILEE
ncbi:PRC-barrel domain-containing protein [Pseudothauera rhizosphaerae]|nr:PRC-barrel domain-containing protein [Pseudothauera rhizosphaerae]